MSPFTTLAKNFNLSKDDVFLMAFNVYHFPKTELFSNVFSKIEMTTNLSDAVKDVDLVVESVEENLAKKKEIFHQLDQICPEKTILAHHSQSLTISEISEKMEKKSRFGGIQFYNPVHISKNVKIIKCISTSQETFEKLDLWGAGMGKETVRGRV